MVDKLQVHDKEIDLASSLNKAMLKQIFHNDSIQIGVIAVAAQKVSGDSFNLIDHNDGTMSFICSDWERYTSCFSNQYDKVWHGSGHSRLPSNSLNI